MRSLPDSLVHFQIPGNPSVSNSVISHSITYTQFIISHEGISGHPQLQVTVVSADQPEYSQQGKMTSVMMCWVQAH